MWSKEPMCTVPSPEACAASVRLAIASPTSNMHQSPLTVAGSPVIREKPDFFVCAHAMITTGAFFTASRAGLTEPIAPAIWDLMLLSLTTIKRQHCVFAQEGDQRAASKTCSRILSSTGVDLYFRMLLLVLIASKTSIFSPPCFRYAVTFVLPHQRVTAILNIEIQSGSC